MRKEIRKQPVVYYTNFNYLVNHVKSINKMKTRVPGHLLEVYKNIRKSNSKDRMLQPT